MKKSIIIILLAYAFNANAQTELEKLVLNELNSYRKIHNLSTVFFDPGLYKVADHHTKWMSLVGFPTMNKLMTSGNSEGFDSHYETVDVPGFTEIFDPKKRGEHFNVLQNIKSFSEICSMTRSTDVSNPIVTKTLTDQQLAKNIIFKFSNSPDHNEELLQEIDNKSILKAGIRVIIKDGIAYTTIYFTEK